MGAKGERVVDTGRVPAAEQFAYWREAVSDAFVPLQLERGWQGPFGGRMRARSIGPLGVARIVSQRQRVTRTRPLIARRGGDVVYVNYQLRGAGGTSQDGRSSEIRPGDFTFIDCTRPFELSFARDFEQICFTLPQELITPRVAAPADATAVRVRGDRGAGALASRALRTLAVEGGALDRSAARTAVEHVAGLVALALNRTASAPGPPARALLFRAATEEAERRLDDPSLSPAAVAAAVGISPRHLHRLFADHDTTFGRWLLGRRLDGAHRDLADPAWDHWPIGALAAARWGFRDAGHFARAFRARYGLTPRAHRRAPR